MKPTRLFPMILLIGVFVLSACAKGPAQPGPSATPQSDGTRVVTLDDQGKAISVAVGDEFLLKLGETYNWDISISDQSVLSRVMGIAVIRGAQGVYQAHTPGTVTLSATGDPQCRQAQPACAMPSLLFTVTITVK
jgi:hypothetical protein